MFQKFENISDPTQGAPRVAALREAMAKAGLDGFLVPRADEHQGEYVPASAERLYWLTGFSGSAGFAAVLREHAGIFVDGRYKLQVTQQCDGDVFAYLNIPGDTLGAWLLDELEDGARVGYDPKLHTGREISALEETLTEGGVSLIPVDDNLVDQVWDGRPEAPCAPVRLHPLKYTGQEARDKISGIQEKLRDAGEAATILTLPDSICWLFNIRGGDISHTPVVLGFAIVHAEQPPELFIDSAKLDSDVRDALTPLAQLHEPGDLDGALDQFSGAKVRVDPSTAGQWFFVRLEAAGAEIVRAHDLVLHAKGRKNATEIDGNRRAHVRDGIAMVNFLAWLDEAAPESGVTEISAAQKLESCRIATGALKDLSFDAISGAGANGAIVHYRVSEATDSPLESGSLYLIDSGGQYLDGTTDITRTIAIGTPSEDMRRCFTLVLKGHIALAMARFPKGTRGADLDPRARTALWNAGLDYDHGTGHGIGSYLSVHEGPASLSRRGMIALEPGMILSNEPGYYREGAFGIRIENLVLVTELAPVPGGERDMMSFETLSFAPIDRRLINAGLLSDEELDWLNGYHADVERKLTGGLDNAAAIAWLKQAAAHIER